MYRTIAPSRSICRSPVSIWIAETVYDWNLRLMNYDVGHPLMKNPAAVSDRGETAACVGKQRLPYIQYCTSTVTPLPNSFPSLAMSTITAESDLEYLFATREFELRSTVEQLNRLNTSLSKSYLRSAAADTSILAKLEVFEQNLRQDSRKLTSVFKSLTRRKGQRARLTTDQTTTLQENILSLYRSGDETVRNQIRRWANAMRARSLDRADRSNIVPGSDNNPPASDDAGQGGWI